MKKMPVDCVRTAYLIDRDRIGGGMEYVRRQLAAHPDDECRVFFADGGECTAAKMNGWGADLIVVNHLRALLQLWRNPFCRPSGKVTFVVHGIHLRKYDFLPKTFANGLRRFLRRGLESHLYRKCDRIVALTETDRTDILRLYGKNLKVEVEPNTLEGWRPRLAEGLPEGITGAFQYVCIGRFDFQKGQDRWIMEKGKRGKAAGDKCGGRTLFIGDGPTLSECRKLAKELGVADLCVFAGAIPEAERYLKCAEVVVSPSRWEGMPYLMMKARLLGCRILATDCPGNRETLSGYERWERLRC